MAKNKSKTKQSVAPSAYNKPYIDAAATNLAPDYTAAQQNITANVMPQVQGVQAFNQRVMGGEMLNGNPYVDAMIERGARDVTNGVNSQFSGAGRYGSGAHQGVLARALGDQANAMRFQNYGQERAYQDQAGGRILQGATVSAALPQMAGGTYADQVARLLGQYNVQTGTQKQGVLGSLLQAGAQAAGAAAAGSDRRLKRNIVKIGELLEDGLSVYVWEYIWGKPMVGVMADEVAEKRPWALGPEFHGFQTVAYGRL